MPLVESHRLFVRPVGQQREAGKSICLRIADGVLKQARMTSIFTSAPAIGVSSFASNSQLKGVWLQGIDHELDEDL